MNSTMLKRTGLTAAPCPSGTDIQRPRFVHARELAAPVRQAILCARQCLLGEQQEDGFWIVGAQPGARLASQLILLLTFLDRDEEESVAALAASVRRKQLPTGGWAASTGMTADVSTSIEAYFALKLAGDDPRSPAMRRARREIGAMGGADRGDIATRYLLALFGQINYDHCPAIQPERLLLTNRCAIVGRDRRFDSWQVEFSAPLAALWSHRPQKVIGAKRGVRELFCHKPVNWPAPDDCGAGNARPTWKRLVGMLQDRLANGLEKWGITPLRHRALRLVESALIKGSRIHPHHAESLETAIWNTFALTTLGYSSDSQAMVRCWRRIDEYVELDAAQQRIHLRHFDSRWVTTSLSAQALIESGFTSGNLAVDAAIQRLCADLSLDSGRTSWCDLNTGDLAELLGSFATFCSCAVPADALPPAFVLHDKVLDDDTQCLPRQADRRDHVQRTNQQIVAELARRQHHCGGWPASASSRRFARLARTPCCPFVTGAVLKALASGIVERTPAIIERGRDYLFNTQSGDGSWTNHEGENAIRTTSSAVAGLLACGVPQDDPSISTATDWLQVQQLPTGGWTEATSRLTASNDSDQRPSPWTTATAIMALIAAGEYSSPAVLQGVNLLVDLQNSTGSWNDHEWSDLEPTTWRSFRAGRTSLMALSRWAVALHDQNEGESPVELRVISTF